MPPARAPQIRSGVDLEALQKMAEPLAVHVMRSRGRDKENIPLEVREGQVASGVGWTIGDILKIDEEIIGIAGGGVYEVQLTDASQPPNFMKWSFMVPTDAYPMRPARTLAPLATPSYSPGPAPWGGLPPAPSAVPFGHGYPAAPQMWAGGWSGSQAVPPGARTAIGGGPSGSPDTAAAMQLAQLTNEIHRRDMQALEERHRHEREMDALQRQAAATAAAAAAPKVDPRFEAMERQLAEAQRQAAEARQHAEREAAERRAKDERDAVERRTEERARMLEAQLAADRRAADEKFNTLMAQMAAAAARPAGPDPMVVMMMEQARAAAETAREQARIEAETTRETARLRADAERANAQAQVEAARIAAESQQKLVTTVQTMMAPNQMSPLDAARMMREATQGSDQFAKTIIGNANDMMEMTRTFMSNMLQMAPQGEGVAGRIVGAIENVAQTFTQGQAQAEAARAHAAAAEARARTQPQAVPGWAPPPPVTQPGQAPAPESGGLNGPGPAPEASAPPPPTDIVDPASNPTLRSGKTDAQWFGPALTDVLKLREGVGVYLAAVAASEAALREFPNEPITVVDEASGKQLGISPLNAARFLLLAANEIRKKNIPGVEAFTYFYEQQMYHALVGVTLPDAPEEYRNNMLVFLNRLLAGEALVKDEDPPMYGIDKFLGDDDEAEEADEADAPPPAGTNGMAIPAAPPRQPAPVGRKGGR